MGHVIYHRPTNQFIRRQGDRYRFVPLNLATIYTTKNKVDAVIERAYIFEAKHFEALEVEVTLKHP